MTTSLSEYNRKKFQELRTELREARLQKAARLILQEPPGTLLDIGCGNGEFSSRFLQPGFTVHGVDLTAEQMDLARGRGIIARQHDLSAGALPYDDGTFTVVFAGEIIEHLVDTTGFLRDIHRILRPGGCLILTTPNLASFENRVRLLFGVYPAWVEYQLEGGQGHVRAYTLGALKRQLRENGFRIERVYGNWVPFVPQRFTDDVRMPWLSLTGTLFPSLSMDLIIKART